MSDDEEIFDFGVELAKLITSGSELQSTLVDESYCLISREKLTDTCVKLVCNHSFNYQPLFNEVKKQKLGKRSTEIIRLQNNQIKCPYCRNVQDKVLPYLPILNVEKIIGINAPLKWEMLNDKCCMINTNKRSKFFNVECGVASWGKYCKKHYLTGNSKVVDISIANVKVENDNKVKCNTILKYGKRKGEPCGSLAFNSLTCKRHIIK